MLIDRDTLLGLREGRITSLYRRWRQARCKAGGRQRTQLGVLRILSVEALDDGELGPNDVSQSGFATLEALVASVSGRPGTVWRIDVEWAGEDPRLALREDTSSKALAEVTRILEDIDARSRSGPWTWQLLRLIAQNEAVRAPDLADQVGMEVKAFKRRVRRLKESGLTVSLSPGYRLSKRGHALLEARQRVEPGLSQRDASGIEGGASHV